MVFLLAYAVAVWAVAVIHRRRWLSFAAVLGSLIPVAAATHLTVMLTATLPEEPPTYAGAPALAQAPGAAGPAQTWLYPVGAAYAGLILGVGMLIAVQPRRAQPDEPCPVCDYELKGIDGACPECGHDTAQPARRRRAEIVIAAPPDAAAAQAARDRLRDGLDERHRAREREDALDRGLTPARGRAALGPRA